MKADESGLLEKAKGKGSKEGKDNKGQVNDQGGAKSQDEGKASKGQGSSQSKGKGKEK